MKFRLPLLSLAALATLIVLSGCSAPALRDPNLLQDTSLLTGEPCAAPCWRGITPGETVWSDALTILEDDAGLENVTQQQDEESAARVAEWQQRGGTPGCCQMYSGNGEIVDLVFVRIAPEVSLGELFEVHGEPTYALSTEFSGDQAIINLIYPETPMVIYAFVAGNTASLSEISEVIGVLYMTQDDMELLISTSNLHAWTGFASYTEYSPEGTFEVTPSITLTPEGATAEPGATDEPSRDGTPETTSEGAADEPTPEASTGQPETDATAEATAGS